jgi:orotidine-5'-phosphate decarboxylase
MNYLTTLIESAEKTGSIISMGIDPVLEEIPEEGTTGERIYRFYESILNRAVSTNILPGAVKPNYAFFAQYGIEGITTLQKLINLFKQESIPVILDVKRGDIGKTAKAYAMECFDFFSADAVTLAPYMGFDSIEPFITGYPDKGYYILTRTSNKSAVDFQDMVVDNSKLYIKVAEKIISWYEPGIGSVVGATYPHELDQILSIFHQSEVDVPLLIPGIGAQGGDLEKTCSILAHYGNPNIHRINSSSGINYAYKKYTNMKYDRAAIEELKRLNDEVQSYLS